MNRPTGPKAPLWGLSFSAMQIKDYLLNWYDVNARDLPWRGSGDPYKIWLSEIMLQQTRTETVIRYYERFLQHFPSVFALAEADEDTVLKLWEGLGYYSRARNLHRAAKLVAASGGHFPDSIEGLQSLPGVGPYAARAIGSIAYGLCAPALDGNQMRVLSRCLAEDRVLRTPFDLEQQALALISRDRPGDYNQALMDLGSSICTAKKPKCTICPLRTLCRAYIEGDPERYPLRPAPVPKREEVRSIFLIETADGFCIQKRSGRLLGGLYEFPTLEGHLSPADAAAQLKELGFAELTGFTRLTDAKHVFTHLIWRMQGWHVHAQRVPDGMRIAGADDLSALAFPSAIRSYHAIACDLLNHNKD